MDQNLQEYKRMYCGIMNAMDGEVNRIAVTLALPNLQFKKFGGHLLRYDGCAYQTVDAFVRSLPAEERETMADKTCALITHCINSAPDGRFAWKLVAALEFIERRDVIREFKDYFQGKESAPRAEMAGESNEQHTGQGPSRSAGHALSPQPQQAPTSSVGACSTPTLSASGGSHDQHRRLTSQQWDLSWLKQMLGIPMSHERKINKDQKGNHAFVFYVTQGEYDSNHQVWKHMPLPGYEKDNKLLRSLFETELGFTYTFHDLSEKPTDFAVKYITEQMKKLQENAGNVNMIFFAILTHGEVYKGLHRLYVGPGKPWVALNDLLKPILVVPEFRRQRIPKFIMVHACRHQVSVPSGDPGADNKEFLPPKDVNVLLAMPCTEGENAFVQKNGEGNSYFVQSFHARIMERLNSWWMRSANLLLVFPEVQNDMLAAAIRDPNAEGGLAWQNPVTMDQLTESIIFEKSLCNLCKDKVFSLCVFFTILVAVFAFIYKLFFSDLGPLKLLT